jgi:hypothetical protein
MRMSARDVEVRFQYWYANSSPGAIRPVEVRVLAERCEEAGHVLV